MEAAHDSAPSSIRSFRDPAGTLIQHHGRILRAVSEQAAAELESFLGTGAARAAMESGKLVRSVRIAPSECPGIETDHLFEHERVAFPSYPYEWPPEMLYAAGELSIELARAALPDGFGLKDATPYNVLFRGSEPVFVDMLSFERRDPHDATWMPYGQFARTFLLPLLASQRFGMPPDTMMAGKRDGIEPETMYKWAGPVQRLLPPFLGLVSIPKWLGKRESSYGRKTELSADKARFILDGILNSCERQLKKVAPVERDSTWSDYLDHKSLYTAEQLAQKQQFVEEALAIARPASALDVGANEGHFSFLAAKHGASVVAIDSDAAVAGSMWRRAHRDGADVLPLVVDLTRPTPAMGWRNRECASFLDRARGSFDLVMMLAVLHHILVTERVPIDEILALAGEISKDYVLLEFVSPQDPMFRRIVRGRDDLYAHMNQGWFEAAALKRFELVRTRRIDGLHRWLYLFRRRRATN